jgi:hypothetical protein
MCRRVAVIALLAAVAVPPVRTEAALTFTVGGTWDTEARRTAAVNAMQLVVDRYNAYGFFGDYNIYVYYNAGIPTAQASHLGSIGFGGTWPAERVAQHELAHYLGLPSGGWNALMSGGTWDGAEGLAVVNQFDGLEAGLNGDSIHFWPYGLNYDSEGSEINKQRQVAVVYAMRADLGIGPNAHPSTATAVTLTASNPLGESGFNYKSQWSDGYFAHAGADYFSGDYAIRTPASANSFDFAGDSLTINNTTTDRGLYYKGQGTTGVVTINNLILDGGWVHHLNGIGDLFQLDGSINVVSDSNLRAKQGNIHILADVTGDGDLTIHPTDDPGDNNRYVRFLSANNTFTGDLINTSRFELSAGANYRFVIGESGENNAITGGSAIATLLNGVFDFDLDGAASTPGASWQLVTAANSVYGPTFDIPGFVRHSSGEWTNNSGFVFAESSGLLYRTEPIIGDLDGDGFVGISDLNMILQYWNNAMRDNHPADPSRDNFVGIEDLNIVLGHWNAGIPPNSAASVPEPTAGLLTGLGVALMMASRGRAGWCVSNKAWRSS